MVILIETDVAMDFLTMRQPYYNDAQNIIQMCAFQEFSHPLLSRKHLQISINFCKLVQKWFNGLENKTCDQNNSHNRKSPVSNGFVETGFNYSMMLAGFHMFKETLISNRKVILQVE